MLGECIQKFPVLLLPTTAFLSVESYSHQVSYGLTATLLGEASIVDVLYEICPLLGN